MVPCPLTEILQRVRVAFLTLLQLLIEMKFYFQTDFLSQLDAVLIKTNLCTFKTVYKNSKAAIHCYRLAYAFEMGIPLP